MLHVRQREAPYYKAELPWIQHLRVLTVNKKNLFRLNWVQDMLYCQIRAKKSATRDKDWGLTRVSIWFRGPDNHIWYGYQIGRNTNIVHCKRTKER